MIAANDIDGIPMLHCSTVQHPGAFDVDPDTHVIELKDVTIKGTLSPTSLQAIFDDMNSITGQYFGDLFANIGPSSGPYDLNPSGL